MKAKIWSPGPARAEEVEAEYWKAQSGAEYADVVDMVSNVMESRQVKVYKVDTWLGKGKYYVAGLELVGKSILGVRVTGLDG